MQKRSWNGYVLELAPDGWLLTQVHCRNCGTWGPPSADLVDWDEPHLSELYERGKLFCDACEQTRCGGPLAFNQRARVQGCGEFLSRDRAEAGEEFCEECEQFLWESSERDIESWHGPGR